MSTVTIILLILSHIILKQTHSLTVTTTATVDENNLQNNGASITTYSGSYSCPSATCWAIYADDQYNLGFHLKLSLDSSFNFHPSYITNLTIEIYYNTNTNWHGSDLLVVFNQQSTDKYVATRMNIDMSSDHGIYPRWSYLMNLPNFEGYANGNPETIVNQYQQSSRFSKLTGGSYWLYSPSRDSNEANVQSPLTFILENHPSSYLAYHYTNPGETIRSCGFPALSTNFPLNIYLAADNNQHYDSLNIEKIKVTHTYNIPTEFPTIAPSEMPTLIPSQNPTKKPTIKPTMTPTVTLYPTDSPTNVPTKTPTILPTILPTINPTISPTKNPSTKPTMQPTIKSTVQTTLQPTEKSLVVIDSKKTTFSGENSETIASINTIVLIDDENIDGNNNANILGFSIWQVSVLGVLLCCCCTLCILGCKIIQTKRKIKQKKYVINTSEHTKNNKRSVASNSTTSVAMNKLSINPSLTSVKLRTTSTLINQYVKSQDDIIQIESRSGDITAITAGHLDEDTGDTVETGDDTGDTGDTATGTDDDVTPTQSSMLDDRIVSNADGTTPYGDIMEMNDEKYNNMFDHINHRYKRSLHSNISFSEHKSNANNQFLPIMPFQNALQSDSVKLKSEIPHHRRIFSEGPKDKDIVKKVTIDGDDEIDKNLKEDEFIIVGEDEMNSDDDMTPSEQQTIGNKD